MPIEWLHGDPLTTTAQTLAFGWNARGRIEVGMLETRLHTTYPTAFAAFGKAARNGRLKAGDVWVWSESRPRLAFLVVRESNVGATRERYLESTFLTLGRDHRLYGVETLALAPLVTALEWPAFQSVLTYWFGRGALPVSAYHP
jgi:hypothetical protein